MLSQKNFQRCPTATQAAIRNTKKNKKVFAFLEHIFNFSSLSCIGSVLFEIQNDKMYLKIQFSSQNCQKKKKRMIRNIVKDKVETITHTYVSS